MGDDEALQRAARIWLRDGYTTAEKVRKLHKELTASRNAAYADALREEMRRQWRTRYAWLPAETNDTSLVSAAREMLGG